MGPRAQASALPRRQPEKRGQSPEGKNEHRLDDPEGSFQVQKFSLSLNTRGCVYGQRAGRAMGLTESAQVRGSKS